MRDIVTRMRRSVLAVAPAAGNDLLAVVAHQKVDAILAGCQKLDLRRIGCSQVTAQVCGQILYRDERFGARIDPGDIRIDLVHHKKLPPRRELSESFRAPCGLRAADGADSLAHSE
jgi:hypothetical protein